MTIEIKQWNRTASYTQGQGWTSDNADFAALLNRIVDVAEYPSYAPNAELAAAEQVQAIMPNVEITTMLPDYHAGDTIY